MNDLLHYAMREAVRLYGDRGDNLFTGAALSTVLSRITGSKACVDGRLIAALLVGRCDVQPPALSARRSMDIASLSSEAARRRTILVNRCFAPTTAGPLTPSPGRSSKTRPCNPESVVRLPLPTMGGEGDFSHRSE